ncbi:hypothetical protein ACER0C_015125 [Sarotherodon galilaeus]
MRKHFGDSGKEKLPFNRKKPPAEPASVSGGHLPRPAKLQEENMVYFCTDRVSNMSRKPRIVERKG